MQLSVCTTGFKEWDIEEIVTWISPLSSDVKGLELWIGHIEKFQETHGPLRKLAKLLESNGLQIPAVSGYTTFSKSAYGFENDFNRMKRLLDVACQLNSPIVRTFAGNVPSKNASPEMWAETVHALKKVARTAELYEIDVAIETHYDTFADDRESVEALLEDIASPRIAIIFDSANLNVDRVHPMEVLESVFPHVRHVHLKNYHWNHHKRYKSNPAPIFEGDVDNLSILHELKKRQYDAFVSLEYFGEKGRPSLLASLKAWKEHVAGSLAVRQ